MIRGILTILKRALTGRRKIDDESDLSSDSFGKYWYHEGDRCVVLYYDWYAEKKQTKILIPKAWHWEEPYADEVISPAKREQIMRKLKAHFEKQKISCEFDEPVEL